LSIRSISISPHKNRRIFISSFAVLKRYPWLNQGKGVEDKDIGNPSNLA
jgi:hypothetical protein